ncbi:hypothetical protein Srubr_34670 [Streptomyces rubradiris]|uniref:Uncharacterized protein n=1 Tax=Streptomyces rubradiris TaxID=285531 RepID=A0ABQ3RCQ7_STRRR|nr:hypothetical protein GCM10018792_03600 [Streptomyces rubradiris]GHI53621.1 hypothetical protein Srubr_34670 [Streptomyces rubradiris]
MRRSGNRMHFMVFTETFDADVMCRFLDQLTDHFDHKVHLVVHGHRAPLPQGPHRARRSPGPDRAALPVVVLARPEPRRAGQRPPQTEAAYAQPGRDQAQLAAEARRFFHRRQRQQHIVRGYFSGPHLRYILE